MIPEKSRESSFMVRGRKVEKVGADGHSMVGLWEHCPLITAMAPGDFLLM